MKSALSAMSSVSDDLCKVIEERKDSRDYVPDTAQLIYRWAFEGSIVTSSVHMCCCLAYTYECAVYAYHTDRVYDKLFETAKFSCS